MKSVTADWIRQFAATKYVQPARQAGRDTVAIRTGDVHTAMGLSNRMPQVCSAIQAQAFQAIGRVRLVSQIGPHQGANRVLTFKILP